MRSGSPTKDAGFTLIELIIVIVVVGVLSAYAMMNNGSGSVFSLLSQAQTMASDIKHAQTLATIWGKRLRVTATPGANGVYSVSCASGGASPCNGSSAVTNPATGTAFSITLEKGVVLSGPAALDITSLGEPVAAASYTLSTDGVSVIVDVAAVTGHVSVVIP